MNKETMLFGLIIFQSGMTFGMLTRQSNGDKRCKASTIGMKIHKLFGILWAILLVCTLISSFLNIYDLIKTISIINLLLFLLTGIFVSSLAVIEIFSCRHPTKKPYYKKFKPIKLTPSSLIRNFAAYMLLLALIYFALPYLIFRLIILLLFGINSITLIFLLLRISKNRLTDKDRASYIVISSNTVSFILCCLWIYSFLAFLSPLFTAICIFTFSLLVFIVSHRSAWQLAYTKEQLPAAKIVIRRLLWIICAESVVALVIALFFSNIPSNGLFILLNITSFFGYTFMFHIAVEVTINQIFQSNT